MARAGEGAKFGSVDGMAAWGDVVKQWAEEDADINDFVVMAASFIESKVCVVALQPPHLDRTPRQRCCEVV